MHEDLEADLRSHSLDHSLYAYTIQLRAVNVTAGHSIWCICGFTPKFSLAHLMSDASCPGSDVANLAGASA